MAGVYNRIEKVAEYYGISMLALSKRIGRKDAQVFYDMKSGKVQGISSNLLEKFKESLPEINMVWLQTGEGRVDGDPACDGYSLFHDANIAKKTALPHRHDERGRL